LAIALLLEDCSLDPVAVAAALKNAWPRLVRSAMAAVEAPADNPMMLTARLETVAGPWKAVEATWISIVPRTDQPSRGRWIATYRKDFAKISRKTKPAVGKPIEEFIEKLIEELATHKADNAVLRLEQESPGWLAIRKNLTEHLRVLQTALKDTPRGRS
jgi:hypothetical protein